MDKTNDEKKYCVYRHVFPNGKCYIGQTSTQLERRWGANGNGYQTVKKDGKYRQPLIANAIKKYGWENIRHEILFENLSKDDASRIEQICICLLRSNNDKFGYNVTSGGECTTHSEKSKRKMSERAKDRLSNPENHPFYKKHHTENAKSKISTSRTGKCTGDSNPTAQAVCCVELNKMWKSVVDAAMELDIPASSIRSACAKTNNMSCGYHWFYLKNYSVDDIKQILIKKYKKNYIPIMCIETGIIYDNISFASQEIGCNLNAVTRNDYDSYNNTIGGYHWKIAEQEWLSKKEQWADELISNLLRNEELMNEVNKLRSEH